MYAFDQKYIDGLIRRDSELERQFTAHFGPMLLIKLRGRLKCPQSIADARDETFVRALSALRNKEAVPDPHRLGAFVNEMCEHVLTDLFGSGRVEMQTPKATLTSNGAVGNQQLERNPDERDRSIKEILQQLSKSDRLLLRRLLLEKRDRGGVCNEINASWKRLGVRLFAAFKRSRKYTDRNASTAEASLKLSLGRTLMSL